MKKKLFTLLLAAVGLSIFQANAERTLEGWIRVDKSGLAKNKNKSENDQTDSFPNNKQWGFDSWLSVKDDVKDDTVYVRPQKLPESSEIATDEYSLFSVDSVAPGRFKIKSKNRPEVFFKGKWDAVDVDVSTFEIVQFHEGEKVGQSIENNSIEGYVVFPFTGQDQTAANAVLAGVDEDGKISFRAFSEFAVHSDSVPASPWLSYQFMKDTVKGRLYQSDTYPYFQTYHKDSALVKNGGNPINWNNGKTKPQNSVIFTYYDFKYNGKGSIFFNNDTVTLKKIVEHIKTVDYNSGAMPSITYGKKLSGIDTTSVKSDSLLYLQVNDKNHITFTALTAGKEWTNGEPSKLPWESDSVWYYIDATDTTKAFYAMVQVLIDLFGFEEDHFIPSKSNIERYIYKNDDNWRPLYMKAVPVTQTKPYEYVTENWLKERDFDLVAATQYIFGFPDLAISEDATVSTENAVRLSFEPAAKIGTDNKINGLTDTKFAGGDIDLFHIKNGDEYLTVSKVAYSSSGPDLTVANTKLSWEKQKITGADSLRQAFAIVHDTDSCIFTFLPVASYKYLGTTYNDTLSYNLRIGEKSKDDQSKDVSVDIDTAWHITFRSVAPQLVITDKPDDENIWLKLAVELKHYWEESVVYEDDSTFTVVYGKGKMHHYSAAGKFANAAGALLTDSIRSHWRVKYIEPENNGKPRVAFTPRIDTIYGFAQNQALTDTVFALDLENGEIALVTYNNRSKRDTVKIESIKSTYTLPFKNLDHLDSLKVAILASGSESYNLSNDNGNAVLKPITATSDTFRVVLHKSNVQTLADGLHVPYYIFSTPDSLFLRANIDTDSVEWVKVPGGEKISLLLDKNNWNAEFAQYKFSLPHKDGTEGEDVYLQTLHNPTQPENYGLIVNGSILFSVNARNFESVLKPSNKYVSSEGIYSALDQYKDNVKAAFWEIRHVGPGQATSLKKVGSSSVKIYGVAGGVRVIDASGSVSVYTVDGRLVSTGAVVSPDQTIAVPAGIYIVKNGVNAVKVVVK